ncbi:MAG: hypothetical protein JOS17DRAFT_729047 [Linnemannia elongata]|nr:MAG: hypothetical protein JOS17DRAFT_729047 [Linnemannia elongata]
MVLAVEMGFYYKRIPSLRLEGNPTLSLLHPPYGHEISLKNVEPLRHEGNRWCKSIFQTSITPLPYLSCSSFPRLRRPFTRYLSTIPFTAFSLNHPHHTMLRLSVTKTWSSHKDTPRTLDTRSAPWRILRQQVLLRENYTCRFCGVRSYKYMICDHIDGNPSHNDPTNLGINCPLCDSVRHCGLAGIRGVLSLGISSMSQKDINLRTLQLFSETNRVPPFADIDSSVVIIANHTAAYANILLKLDDDFDYTSQCTCHSTPHTYDMHKGFYRQPSTDMFWHILNNSF